MDEFITLAYLLSYPGMLAVVILLTQFTKNMIQVATKYVVLFWALCFAVLSAVFQGDFSSPAAVVSTIVVWFVNAIIIWFAAMKAFETVAGEPTDGTFILDQSDPDTDRFRIDLGDNLAGLGSKSVVKLLVDTKTPIPPE